MAYRPHRSHRPTLLLMLPLIALATTLSAQSPSQAELDQRFAEMMNGAQLTGKFNVVGPQGETAPQADLYMLSELTRGEGDSWIFNYSMTFNQSKTMIPIPVDVLWAGETPVLTMTEQEIEGLQGKFSARILIHDGKYAGTWQHGPVGGHMWGVLEKVDKSSDDSANSGNGG